MQSVHTYVCTLSIILWFFVYDSVCTTCSLAKSEWWREVSVMPHIINSRCCSTGNVLNASVQRTQLANLLCEMYKHTLRCAVYALTHRQCCVGCIHVKEIVKLGKILSLVLQITCTADTHTHTHTHTQTM